MSPDILEKKESLSRVVQEVRDLSYFEKKEKMTEEEVMDTFLDAINDFKRAVIANTSKIEEITTLMESLTWYTNPDDSSLSQLNELVIMCKDTHSSLIHKYVSYNAIRKANVASAELSEFKHSIDLFKETFCDLESVFFTLPKNSGFQRTTEGFSNLSHGDLLH